LRLAGFAQDDTGVDVALSDGQSLRADYLVGCDGGRSLIRKAAGIEFPGWDPTTSSLIAEVETAEEPEWGIRHDALGVHSFSRLEYEIRDGQVVYMDRGPVRVMVTEQHPGRSDLRQGGSAQVFGRGDSEATVTHWARPRARRCLRARPALSLARESEAAATGPLNERGRRRLR
jgi:2-polyprenyl-6-methoxyphenol hydroxylase-like FAD-dependent oxidoreductase